MCGIAGFSLNPETTAHVKVRKVAKAMLLDIESRGRDATGFAFLDSTGKLQVHKDAMTATHFVRRRLCLPRNTRTAIMHTRFATQGRPEWNDNNHPILTGGIAGVHNGHVNNDWDIFLDLEKEFGRDIRIAQVDSEAIFAALAYKLGNDPKPVLETIEGGAAVAWLDEDDERPNRLHLARIKSSPLDIVTTKDGSLFFASTAKACLDGIKAAGLEVAETYLCKEGSYIQVLDGEVLLVEDFEVPVTRWTSTRRIGATTKVYSGSFHGWDDDEYVSFTPSNGGTLDDRLAAEEADVLDELETSDWSESEKQQYMDWWRQNLQAVEDDAKAKADKAERDRRWEDFNHAYRLNAFYLMYPDVPLKRQDDTAYLSDNRHVLRETNIEQWCAGFRADEETRTDVAGKLRAHVRPGDPVRTHFMGRDCWGTVHTVPTEFPGGIYTIRLFVGNERRKDGIECAFITRRYYEFRATDPQDNVPADDASQKAEDVDIIIDAHSAALSALDR